MLDAPTDSAAAPATAEAAAKKHSGQPVTDARRIDARALIRAYVLENFLFSDDPSDIADDTSFLARGIIDSMGALELALFIEQRFGFTVHEAEMLPENLDSVDNLVAFVTRRQQAQ